ncbi:MAG: N-acetyltransferase [Wenzhouxiangella sp.]|nr:MAG: N-acetyltransferase [Wenzhouxiangella sp.]
MSSEPAQPDRFTTLPLGLAWCEAIVLADGQRLIMRPIQPNDVERLQRSFKTLSPHDVRMRFMHPLKELTPAFARQLTRIDPERAFALVLVEAKPPEEALIGAVARVALDDDGREAEFAIVVGPDIRRFGLGRYLMKQLINWCREKRLEVLYGFILQENRPMQKLAEELGFEIGPTDEDTGVVLARLALD